MVYLSFDTIFIKIQQSWFFNLQATSATSSDLCWKKYISVLFNYTIVLDCVWVYKCGGRFIKGATPCKCGRRLIKGATPCKCGGRFIKGAKSCKCIGRFIKGCICGGKFIKGATPCKCCGKFIKGRGPLSCGIFSLLQWIPFFPQSMGFLMVHCTRWNARFIVVL